MRPCHRPGGLKSSKSARQARNPPTPTRGAPRRGRGWLRGRRSARGLTRRVLVAVHDHESRGDVVADGQRGEGQSGRREGADDSLAHHGSDVEVSEGR